MSELQIFVPKFEYLYVPADMQANFLDFVFASYEAAVMFNDGGIPDCDDLEMENYDFEELVGSLTREELYGDRNVELNFKTEPEEDKYYDTYYDNFSMFLSDVYSELKSNYVCHIDGWEELVHQPIKEVW